MNQGENRQLTRDSLFLLADLRVDGLDGDFRIKVRNLSVGGMMGEGTVRVIRGTMVQVRIRNIGWVKGSIAWVQESRFGVAFHDEIDPRLARASVEQVDNPIPEYMRNLDSASNTGAILRKI